MIGETRKNLKLHSVWILFSFVFFWQMGNALPAEVGTGAKPADTEVGIETMAAKGQAKNERGSVDGASESAPRSLEKLEQLLTKQSSEIEALRQQLREQSEEIKQLKQTATASASLPTKASLVTGNTSNVTSVNSSQQQPVDRLEKVEKGQQNLEEQVRKFGPFRFGGDFRYRLDSITRSSKTLADGSTIPSVQNIRMRYRLRLNFDTDIDPQVSFHGQLSTGPYNNAITLDQDFTSTIARHPFLISEAWIDYHPNKSLSLKGGKVQEVFADNSRFLFDDDVRFNGFNETFVHTFAKPVLGLKSIELRGGQYIFSNPNVVVVREGDPLATAGARIGSKGRAAQSFHQGFLLNQALSENVGQQFGADIQAFRNPNQIALASTTAGAALIVGPGLGVALSGPMTGTGNATTTPGGAIYTARNFQVGRITYSLNHKGLGQAKRPLSLNVQLARNMGTSFERDALLAALSLGQAKNPWDWRLLYLYSIKGANSMISQLTDDDLGTITGVNIRAHHLRFDLALTKRIQFQSLVFFQNELRSSGQFPRFFVPLGAFTPLQIRFQEHLVFTF
jgi:hypothetical protein